MSEVQRRLQEHKPEFRAIRYELQKRMRECEIPSCFVPLDPAVAYRKFGSDVPFAFPLGIAEGGMGKATVWLTQEKLDAGFPPRTGNRDIALLMFASYDRVTDKLDLQVHAVLGENLNKSPEDLLALARGPSEFDTTKRGLDHNDWAYFAVCSGAPYGKQTLGWAEVEMILSPDK